MLGGSNPPVQQSGLWHLVQALTAAWNGLCAASHARHRALVQQVMDLGARVRREQRGFTRVLVTSAVTLP